MVTINCLKQLQVIIEQKIMKREKTIEGQYKSADL